MISNTSNNYKRVVSYSVEVEAGDIDTSGSASLSNSEGTFAGTEAIADGTYNIGVNIDGAGAADVSTGALADTSGIAEISNAGSLAAFTGATASGLGAATYDLDVQVDQENTVATWPISMIVAGAEDWDAIAGLIQTSLQTASSTSPTVTITGGKFLISSATAGDTSRIIITAGTAGSGGGDLLGAITALSADYTATIDTPVDGVETSVTLAVAGISGNLSGATIAITDGLLVVTSDTDGPTSSIVLTEGTSAGLIAGLDAISGVTTVIDTPTASADGRVRIPLVTDTDSTYTDFLIVSAFVVTAGNIEKTNGLKIYKETVSSLDYVTVMDDGTTTELVAGDTINICGLWYK